MSQPTTRLIRSPAGRTPDQPNRQPTRRAPVTRRIVAELDRAGNVPFVAGYMGRWGYPRPRTGFAEGRTYTELARAIYETPEPTAAQVKAVQRAARRLVEAGRIEAYRGSGGEVVLRRLMTEADHRCRAEVERRAREWREARAEAEANATAYPVDTGNGIETVMVEPVLKITEDGVELRETTDEQDPDLGRQDVFSLLRRALPAGEGT